MIYSTQNVQFTRNLELQIPTGSHPLFLSVVKLKTPVCMVLTVRFACIKVFVHFTIIQVTE
jgi:hypothetical protein